MEKPEVYEGEVVTSTALVAAGAEIDQQVSTAKKYPRSIKAFRSEMLDMVTLNEEVASECIFAVPRGKEDGKQKFIEGASVRFAEIAISAYGNARCGSRPVMEEQGFVTAQGFFHDLEKNVAITVEVRRSITDKYGKRFSADMINVTTNAACSIARRNAILQGVPKALWKDLYDEAKKTAIGTAKTLVSKRSDMMLYFQKMNVTPETIYTFMGVPGIEDIGLDELAMLKGIATAIKEGVTTVDKAFVVDDGKPVSKAAATVEKINKAKGPEVKPETTDLLQEVYTLLAKLAGKQGEYPDDVINTLTKGKVGTQVDLQDKPLPYLLDIKLMIEAELGKE